MMSLRSKTIRILAATALIVLTQSLPADWSPAPAPLFTPWARDVNPEAPLAEYPRPVMVRPDWLNLNGLWHFGEMDPGDPVPGPGDLPEQILVPFAWESALSGIRRELDSLRAWYQRSVEIPAEWEKQAILLHFGAVDFEAKVYVNGQYVCEHRGGFDPFHCDIAPFLADQPVQQIAVAVYDPTNREGIAVGKQNKDKFANPERFSYSAVSGIWQTVWLEPVPGLRVQDFRAVPDIDAGTLRVTVDPNRRVENLTIEVIARAEGREIGRSENSPDDLELITTVSIPDARLWWPHDPYLYDMEIVLKQDGREIDRVSSYFGMRKIALADHYQGKIGPFKKLELNNRFVFQMGPLDQGYWPDGLYTAPTDEALAWEVEQIKAWGFNMVRKHIKVEPQRWYYHCDRLGLLVWQDMPNTFLKRTQPERDQFELELQRLVKTHWNHPSIVNWIVFNEHWGAYDVPRLTRMVMGLDPSRMVTGNSGIDAGRPNLDYEVGHLKDNHHYRPPTAPYVTDRRAAVNGEYGAIGYLLEGHLWDEDGPWVHYNYDGKEAATAEYEKFISELLDYKTRLALSGAVYTQWTDLENEMNGLYTYDREEEKLDRGRVTRANRSLWEDDL
jgi:beta-galactosidase/beta-glucuronidase